MRKELEKLVELYYTEKKYQEVLNITQHILDTKVEDVNIVKQYSKRKINEIMSWIPSVHKFKIRALLRLEQYQKAIEAIQQSIAYCKELVDYFPGFFISEEVLLYKLHFLLNNTEEIEKLRKIYTEKDIKEFEQEAKDKIFDFAY